MFDLAHLPPLIAFPGHLAICAMAYNRLHSLPYGKKTRDVFEAILVLWGAAFLCAALSMMVERALVAALPSTIEASLAIYIVVCIAVFVWVASVWGWRQWTFRVPDMLLSNHTRTYNAVEALGHRPVGRLTSRLAAAVPGNQLLELDVNEKTFAIPSLNPALDGLSITHISDLHYTGHLNRAYYEWVMEKAQELESELIAVTGDIVDKQELAQWIPETLGQLNASSGVYFILGNHDKRLPDPDGVRAILSEAGLVDLGSACKEIVIRDSQVLLCGNELVWFGPPPDPPARPSGDGSRPLRILLSHSPDQLSWARCRDFDLMLAGHTHGGQIRFPVVGPVIAPSRYGVKYASGVFYKAPTLMHVSRGISAEHPVRYNCRPELTKILLRCADSTSVAT